MTGMNYVYIYINEDDDNLMPDMTRGNINLLDLPDELLLLIMKKMKRRDILYSLLGVTEELDRLTCSISHTYLVNLTRISSADEHICMDPDVFDRFCFEIIPRISHDIRILIVDHWTMKRALSACEYPALRSIVFSNFHPNTILDCLKGKSK